MSDVSDQWWAEYASNPAAPKHSSRSTDRRALKNAAKAEKKVGRELAWLGDEWHVLHVVDHSVVDRADRGADVEHILIGPAGVLTLTTRRLRNSSVLVTGSRLLVDGHPSNCLPEARHASQRVEQLLSEACGEHVAVRTVVVFVDLDDFRVQHMPSDVHVTTCRRLLPWLKSLLETTDPSTVELIRRAAVGSTAEVLRREDLGPVDGTGEVPAEGDDRRARNFVGGAGERG